MISLDYLSKMENKLLYILLAIVPITNLFDLFFPISILGFSFWNTFLVFAVLHLLLFKSKIKYNEFFTNLNFFFLLCSSCFYEILFV